MKLLYILSEYLPDSGGGIISFYANLLPGLVERGHEVEVLVASFSTLDRPTRIANGVKVEYLQSCFTNAAKAGCGKFKNDFLCAFLPLAWGAYNQTKGGEGFDIVEATDWGLLFMPWVVSSRKAKVVVSLHGSNGQLDWYSASAQRGSFDGGFVRLLETESLRLAERLHANSRSNAAFWSDRTGCEVQVIPPVFDSLAALSSVGKSNNGLVVGRLQSLKGAEVLCQALTQIKGIQIEWVGKDLPWESGSETTSSFLANKYPDVFGQSLCCSPAMPHTEVLQKIANASFLVVASVWEVFNLTVLEAMAAGTPVICSRNAGAEMMIEDGVTGFLFDPENPADLAKKMKEVAALSGYQREAMICKAKDYLKKTLDSDIIMHLLEKSYTETLAVERQVEPDLWLSKFLELDFDSENAPSNSFPQRLASKIRRLIAATRL
jgi:glycosyltransferase involved in cell wall biosynthesis